LHILRGFCTIVPLDPTESFQKQIQQTINKCNTVLDENQQKHLIKIKSMAPKLNALIKN